MKRLIFILILMVIVPFVSATITIDNNLLQEKYNLGDKVTISGSVVTNDDFRGFISYNLICQDLNKQLLIQSISLTGQKEYQFSQSLPLLEGIGQCHIDAYLNNLNNSNIESENSSSFTITKDLDANFNINDQKLKLGEILNITGTIFKLNGANVNGRATVTLKLDNNPYLIDSKDVTNGDFSYVNTLSSLPAGSYTTDVYIRDLDGNERLFENATSFNINNNLNINAAASKLEAKPGEEITISGEMRDFDENLISSNVNAYIEVNGAEKYQIILKDGKFSNKIKLKQDTKSGPNKIRIFAEDEFGNVGEKVFFVNVNPIPTKLEVKSSNSESNPREDINFYVILYDQANDEIKGQSATLEVKDSDNKKVVKENVITGNEAFKLSLLDYAKPGRWTVKAESNNLENSLTFNVNELESLDAQLNDIILTILNNGNIDFNRNIELDFNGYKVEEKIDLSPKDTKEVELNDKIENGTYHLIVSTGTKQFDLGNITISKQGFRLGELTGAFLGSGSGSYWWIIILVIIIIILLYFFIIRNRRGHHKGSSYSRERDYQTAQEKVRRLKEERERAKKKNVRRSFSASPIKDEDVREFREAVLKNIKDDEKSKGTGIFKR